MSDRRFVVVVVGMLAALLGVAAVALAVFGMRDPMLPSGEIGTPRDSTREMLGLLVLGVVLIVGGCGSATVLVRRHLDGHRPPFWKRP